MVTDVIKISNPPVFIESYYNNNADQKNSWNDL